MSSRAVHAHELGDDQGVVIVVRGDIDLDLLESIEGFCHRQRFLICKQMQAKLAEVKPDSAPAEQT